MIVKSNLWLRRGGLWWIAVLCLVIAAPYAQTNDRSVCPPTEQEPMVFCDLRFIQSWPEAELLDELRQRMSSEFSRCRAEGLEDALDFFIKVPEEPTAISRSFSDVQFQFYDVMRGGDRTQGLAETDPSEADPTQGEIQTAIPQKSVELTNVFGKPLDEETKPDRAAELIEFVFVPRIEQGEVIRRQTPEGEEEQIQLYNISPVTAVPARILDTLGTHSGVEINLRRLRKELEAVGITFINIMRRHFESEMNGEKRLRKRTAIRYQGSYLIVADSSDLIREGSQAFPPREETQEGLPYTWDELAYFDLELRRRIGQDDPNAKEGLLRKFDYIRRFRKFWEEMEKRAAFVKEQDKREEQDIFSSK